MQEQGARHRLGAAFVGLTVRAALGASRGRRIRQVFLAAHLWVFGGALQSIAVSQALLDAVTAPYDERPGLERYAVPAGVAGLAALLLAVE